MTVEQQKARERLARYISREGLVSVMNDTKWQEVIQAVRDATPGSVRFRVKEVRGSESLAGQWTRGPARVLPPPAGAGQSERLTVVCGNTSYRMRRVGFRVTTAIGTADTRDWIYFLPELTRRDVFVLGWSEVASMYWPW